MPSPFPGMNPYLEQESVWHDFHERFIPLAAELIGSQVKPRYIVKIDERVYIRELSAESRQYVGRADVAVTSKPRTGNAGAGPALLEAPAKVQLPRVDIERISYVEILDRNNWQLITVMELLSPSNKYAGPDRDQYVAKRSQLLASPVHFVEMDLLRGGPRLPLDNLPECDYYVMVSRAEARPDAGVWPLQLRDRLPIIPVPVRDPEASVELDLQQIVHRLYDAAQYESYIYLWQPQPTLSTEDADWAHAFVPRVVEE